MPHPCYHWVVLFIGGLLLSSCSSWSGTQPIATAQIEPPSAHQPRLWPSMTTPVSTSILFIALLLVVFGLSLWFGLPPLQRAFAPHVTVKALQTNPSEHVNRVVEVHGDLRTFLVTVCGTPGGSGVLLTDIPDPWPLDRAVPIVWEQPFPTTAIELRRDSDPLSFSNNILASSLTDGHRQDVTIWGRLQQETIERCPGDSANPERIYLYLDIERIQLADGQVLP